MVVWYSDHLLNTSAVFKWWSVYCTYSNGIQITDHAVKGLLASVIQAKMLGCDIIVYAVWQSTRAMGMYLMDSQTI